MLLQQLIDGLDLQLVQGSGTLEISDLTDDSRQVTPGCAFIVRPGTKTNGSAFLADALQRGAAAIITEERCRLADVPQATAMVHAKVVDQALAGRLAERFFGEPSRRLKIVGITGTKGKTTIAFLVQQMLNFEASRGSGGFGGRCGMIGTVYIDDGVTRRPAELTTPGAIDFSRYLGAMVRQGCQAAVAEFSSHALHQGRIAALHTDVAVFTNLTGDHLDYHKTMDAYADAKAILFETLAPGAVAVVNLDDPYADRMRRGCRAEVLGCTLVANRPGASVWARILELGAGYARAVFRGPWGEFTVKLPLLGRHNVLNALQAAAAVWVLTRMPPDQLKAALEQAVPPPGRFEPVRVESTRITPTVLVDYAHTHDALAKTLEALRPLTSGRLMVMFGCGGDRDRTKRPKMAAEACRLADVVVITSDNPRTEDPQAIMAEILQGVPPGIIFANTLNKNQDAADVPEKNQKNQKKYMIEQDRAAAIAQIIAEARPGDMVLLAGKGHEDYQIIGTTKRHFDDREHAAAALRKWRPATP